MMLSKSVTLSLLAKVSVTGILFVLVKVATVLVPDEFGYRTNSWTPSKKYIPIAQAELDSDPALKQNDY